MFVEFPELLASICFVESLSCFWFYLVFAEVDFVFDELSWFQCGCRYLPECQAANRKHFMSKGGCCRMRPWRSEVPGRSDGSMGLSRFEA